MAAIGDDGLGIWSAEGSQRHRVIGRAGAAPELVAYWRLGVGRTAPVQPLRLDLLLAGGALSGPMFEWRPGPLVRLWRRLCFDPSTGSGQALSMRKKQWTGR